MDLLLLCGVLLTVCLTILWKVTRNTLWNSMPGPSYTWPFIGNFSEIRHSHNFSDYLSLWAKQYGSIYRYYVIGQCRVMVSDPAIVKQVLLNNHLYDKNLLQYRVMANTLGYGLVTQPNEAKHKYHRSIISPAFAHSHTRAMVPVFHRKGLVLVEDWLKAVGTGKQVSIKEDIAKATSDVMGEVAFGYQLNSQRNASPSSVYSIMASIMKDGLNIFELIPFVQNHVPAFKKRMQSINVLNKQVASILAQKEEKRKSTVRLDSKDREERDLLDILMDCQNEDGAVLTREELADQTKTFLFAGYETSSVCVFWTMHMLAKHPEIQHKLADEVISVIGSDKLPTADDIDRMPYLFSVLRESLRYYPPIPFIVRQNTEPVTLGGYYIPKGTQILINIYHQHRHGTVWSNPEIFDPDRWALEEDSINLHGYYIPFAVGARNCIGSKFAMLEVRVLLAMILQKLKFEEPAGQKEPGTKARVSLQPRSDVHMLFSAR